MFRNFLAFADLVRGIKELQDKIEPLFNKNLDFGKRRITNAHPSIDDYDYVVRKELKKAVEDITINKTVGGGAKGVEQTVWLEISLPGTRSVANDVTDTRVRVAIDDNMKLVLKRSLATVKTTPPTTIDYVANILRSNDASGTFATIYAGTADANRLKITASAHRGEQDTFAIKEFFNNDELRVDEVKTGNAVGIHLTVMFKLVKK